MYTRSTLRFASAFAACAAVSLATLTSAAHAQNNFFPTNATLDSSNKVTGDAFVGYDAGFVNATSPTVNLVSGGSVSGYLDADNSSIVNMSSGSVGSSLVAFDSSTINLSGGSVGNTLQAGNSGTINLFGTGQTTTLVNANNSGYSQYSLSGTLSDGTVLVNKTLYVQNGTGARFTLNNAAAVPEPGSVALLPGLTTVGANLLRKRRVRK